MREFWSRFLTVTLAPDAFFEQVREKHNWRMPLLHLLILIVWLSLACSS